MVTVLMLTFSTFFFVGIHDPTIKMNSKSNSKDNSFKSNLNLSDSTVFS